MSHNAAYELAAQDARQYISMRAAAERWGFTPNRAGFICCPFHREKTPSLHLWEDHYYCFGCGVGGDLVDFTMRLHDMGFLAAVELLNDEFSLGYALKEKQSYRERRRAVAERERRKLLAAQRRAAERRISERCDKALSIWTFYDICRVKFAPRSPGEELHPLYVMAVQDLPRAAEELNEAETERWRFEQEQENAGPSGRQCPSGGNRPA